MKDYKKLLSEFAGKWNDSDDNTPQSEEDIAILEKHFNIKLPESYRYFLSTYGNLSTQTLPVFALHETKYLPDVIFFFDTTEIIEITTEVKGEVPKGFICIAPLVSEGFLCLSIDDCEDESTIDMPVYVYSHDHNEIYEIQETFTELIASYNKVKKQKPSQKKLWQFWK